MKIITSTHYNRPTCTKMMLDHLAECKGVEDYKIICCVEPVNNVIPSLIESHPLNTELVVNNNILGLWENKKKALSLGFSESDYVIHVEDDILLSKDSLSMFEFCYNLKDDPSMFSVTGFCANDHQFAPENIRLLINRQSWYNPWGWATWEDRWASYKDKWDGHDHTLNHEIRGDRLQAYPELSRVKSIGYIRGEYTSDSCDDEILKVIKDNKQIELWVKQGVLPAEYVHKCHSKTDFQSLINKHLSKQGTSLREIIKMNDTKASTKASESWNEDVIWAGDYKIPNGGFELQWT